MFLNLDGPQRGLTRYHYSAFVSFWQPAVRYIKIASKPSVVTVLVGDTPSRISRVLQENNTLRHKSLFKVIIVKNVENNICSVKSWFKVMILKMLKKMSVVCSTICSSTNTDSIKQKLYLGRTTPKYLAIRKVRLRNSKICTS